MARHKVYAPPEGTRRPQPPRCIFSFFFFFIGALFLILLLPVARAKSKADKEIVGMRMRCRKGHQDRKVTPREKVLQLYGLSELDDGEQRPSGRAKRRVRTSGCSAWADGRPASVL